MPEMHFVARWPDGDVIAHYSPSLIVRDYLRPGAVYALPEFVERSRTALRIASDRVREKYGYACPRAARTLAEIERKARDCAGLSGATVQIEALGNIK